METTISMKDLLKDDGRVQFQPELTEFSEDFMDTYAPKQSASQIAVQFVDVEEIIVPEIKDNKGRLSDIVETIENLLNISVVPLEMTTIAAEVVKLQRHEIMTINGKRYAMSKTARDTVVNQMCAKIINTFTNGVQFTENLTTNVTYKDRDFKTLSLSRVEWTLILSKFRSYKQSLSVKSNGDVILEIFPERNQ